MSDSSCDAQALDGVRELRSYGARVDTDARGNPIEVQWGLLAPINDAGLEVIRNLKTIRRLELHGAMTDQRLKHLSSLPVLDTLLLVHSYLPVQPNTFTSQGMKSLSSLTALTSLSLATIGLIDTKGMECLKGLTNLRTLDLSFDVSLDWLRQLEHLRLSGLSVPSSLGLDYVSLFPGLKAVFASEVSEEDLTQLRNLDCLEELGLASCTFSDRAVDQLLQLSTLRIMRLFDTGITEGGIEKLRRGLPNCLIET